MVKKIIAHPLIEKFISLEEKELTEKIIMPFLKAIKYSKVEYFGGVYEEGKDIICWGLNEFDQTILAVAQVKKFRPTAVASDDKSFSEVITQLQQCCEKKVPNLNDGKEYTPEKVYFFTPYPIDTRALKTRFEKYQELREKQVQIIDGDFLAKQVEKTLPDIVCDLLGEQQFFKERIVDILNNKELLNALQFSYFVDISKIYSDLDFCLGGISSTQFVSYNFSSKKAIISLEHAQWELLKEISNFLREKINTYIFLKSIENIEKEYDLLILHNNNIRDKIKIINQQKKKLSKSSDTINETISRIIDEIKNNLDEKNLKGKDDFENYNNYINGIKLTKHKKENITESKYHKDLKKYEDSIIYFELKFFRESNYKNIINQTEENHKNIEEKNIEIQKLTKQIKNELYSVEINSNDLVSFLKEKQEWIKRKAREFNEKKPSTQKLRTFLVNCQDLFELVEKIISNQIVYQFVGFEESDSKSLIEPEGEERFSFSVHSIFDTRLNFILLGGAGAGKTTSLQMYTKNQLENTFNKVFYFPLARVLSTISKLVEKNIPAVVFLQKGIVNFLKLVNPKITQLEFEKTISESNSVCMFDGIDEVIGSYPWITNAINEFGNRFRKVQVIISSRFGGKYFEKLSFLSIKLLPFTDNQRERFIKAWFEDKEEVNTAEIIEHLNNFQEMGEIVRTPLLATILCVLAEFKIPLPESEVRLYKERMNLLLGYYDTHKGIKRIRSNSEVLEFVARKLAFDFHNKSIRNLSYDRILKNAIALCRGRFSEEIIATTVNELIDPCNVIVAMTNNGELGFEHLRYQEYLAARELVVNRGIPTRTIRKWLHDASWRGALVLFSKMTDNLEFLINDVIYNDNVSTVSDTLFAMIEVRPLKERESLREMVEKHYDLDKIDSMIFQFM